MQRSFLITVQDFACGRLDDLGADLRLDVLDQLDGLLVLLLGDQCQLCVAHRLERPNDLETHLLGDQVKYGAHVGDDVLFVQSIERFWVLTKMAKGIFDRLPRPLVEVALAAPSRVSETGHQAARVSAQLSAHDHHHDHHQS